MKLLIIALIVSLLIDAATNIGRMVVTVWAVRETQKSEHRIAMEYEARIEAAKQVVAGITEARP